jgi:K(+)-stimulated pyrophosphate-energized sodium pump
MEPRVKDGGKAGVVQSCIGRLVGVLAALFVLACAAPAFAGESASTVQIDPIWWIAPCGSVLALFFAYIFHKSMVKGDPGDENMQKIAGYVRTGAMAYLKQQYKIVGIFFVVICILLSIMAFVLKVQSPWVPFAFLTGGFFSGLSGYLGMNTATKASNRTAAAAKHSLDAGLKVAFRSGAVMGLVVVGLGLLDISIWFYVLTQVFHLELREVTVTMLCFGMGASSQALFARVGGGIFTKSADVGADLVGKVEAGIPEDDPRNPANVGDNVGDVAGMGADLYESYCGSILATAALGCAAATSVGSSPLPFIMLPMVIAGIGIVLSIIGILVVRTREGAGQKELLGSMMKGINLSSVLIFVASMVIVWFMLHNLPTSVGGIAGIIGNKLALGIGGAIAVGLLAGVGIGYCTGYYTSGDYKPTQGIAKHSLTGPATVIIDGLAVGMMSTAIPVVIVSLAVMLSFGFAGGFSNTLMGLYGVSIAAVGMLATLGITLATDAYGPIADNAGGNAQMTGQKPEVRERTDILDSLGNTTAATGKGFAIGSAALTALALLAAYIEEVRIGIERVAQDKYSNGAAQVEVYNISTDKQELAQDVGDGIFVRKEGEKFTTFVKTGTTITKIPKLESVEAAPIGAFMTYYDITLMNPKVLVGLFLGSMMVFVFCAMTMKAVGRAAGRMVDEVRRQFKEIVGLMEGKAEADYASCVTIATKGAQHEMIVPSLLALTVPVACGVILGVAGVMGLLAGGLATGFVMAVMMANSGGAWDNAKKYIESGQLGGKGSPAHKAAVVGDTVGDPFKDTCGPSLNILIKLMSMVAVVFAGLTVKFGPRITELLGIK